MKKFMCLFILAICLTAAGCAGTGKFTMKHHNNPTPSIVNEKYVDPFPEDVWNNLVKELATTYFMINNIDKESRIINVSFGVDNPEKYVDCGNTIVETDIPSQYLTGTQNNNTGFVNKPYMGKTLGNGDRDPRSGHYMHNIVWNKNGQDIELEPEKLEPLFKSGNK